MRRRVKRLNDAVIGQNNGRDSGCGKGFAEGPEPTIASAIGDRQRDPQGKGHIRIWQIRFMLSHI
jgi:hypothetical protein